MTDVYGNVAGFTAYHEARGREAPGTWDDAVISAALLVASEWIDGIYGADFSGFKTGGFTQDREWPRMGSSAATLPIHIFSTTDIPARVINAAYEAAWREATTNGSLQVDFTPGKYKTVSIERGLSVDFTQFSNASDIQTQIMIIDTLLWPLLNNKEGRAGQASSSGNVTRT